MSPSLESMLFEKKDHIIVNFKSPLPNITPHKFNLIMNKWLNEYTTQLQAWECPMASKKMILPAKGKEKICSWDNLGSRGGAKETWPIKLSQLIVTSHSLSHNDGFRHGSPSEPWLPGQRQVFCLLEHKVRGFSLKSLLPPPCDYMGC